MMDTLHAIAALVVIIALRALGCWICGAVRAVRQEKIVDQQGATKMSKFKATIDKQFLASDGTAHKTRDAHERHERKILVDRIAGYGAPDLDAAVLGNNVPVATDIILLASLLRPPRAKRAPANPSPPAPPANIQAGAGSSDAAHADDAGQSASDPAGAAAPSTMASTESARIHAAGELATADTSAADQNSGVDAQAPTNAQDEVAAPHEQPEAAGDAPAPVASVEATPEPRGHKRGKAREGAAA
jgi:hypothetical protein